MQMHHDVYIGTIRTLGGLKPFNHILKAHDTIQYSTSLIDFWYEKPNWKHGVKQSLRDQVSRLDANVQRGDTDI